MNIRLPRTPLAAFRASRRPVTHSRRSWMWMAALGCLAAAAGLCPWRLGVVKGHSMEPTLTPGSVFFFHAGSPGPVKADRGDIVLVEMAGQICVKRIYALPGQEFWALREDGETAYEITPVSSASLQRVRRLVEMAGSASGRRLTVVRYRVPLGHVFLTGDSPASLDSRQLGTIPAMAIRGRVLGSARIWRPANLDLSFPPSSRPSRGRVRLGSASGSRQG